LVTDAINACRAEFGVEDDGLPMDVWLGDGPETAFADALDAYLIYLGRSVNYWQAIIQGAHEAFHRVCTPGNKAHWSHEMLAVHFSLLHLERTGHKPYADTNRGDMHEEAQLCTPHQIAYLVAGQYPPGTHGRAYAVGEALITAIEWEQLKSLALARNTVEEPSIEAWLGSLSEPIRAKALDALPPVLARDWPAPH
jgi:hypothetical protein